MTAREQYEAMAAEVERVARLGPMGAIAAAADLAVAQLAFNRTLLERVEALEARIAP